MWKVEYSNSKNEKVLHHEEFFTRKSARLWCKKHPKPDMVLIDPQGNREAVVI